MYMHTNASYSLVMFARLIHYRLSCFVITHQQVPMLYYDSRPTVYRSIQSYWYMYIITLNLG